MEVDISEQLVQSLVWSRAIALERGHESIQVADLVLGVVQFVDRLAFLQRAIAQNDLRTNAALRSNAPGDLPMSADATALLDRAIEIATDRNEPWCRPLDVLLALIERGGSLAEEFARNGITADYLESLLQGDLPE